RRGSPRSPPALCPTRLSMAISTPAISAATAAGSPCSTGATAASAIPSWTCRPSSTACPATPQARKIPSANRNRRPPRPEAPPLPDRRCPRQVGGRAAGPGEEMAVQMLIECAGPWLGSDGTGDLGEIRHPASVRTVELGLEQPQDRDVDAIAVAHG